MGGVIGAQRMDEDEYKRRLDAFNAKLARRARKTKTPALTLSYVPPTQCANRQAALEREASGDGWFADLARAYLAAEAWAAANGLGGGASPDLHDAPALAWPEPRPPAAPAAPPARRPPKRKGRGGRASPTSVAADVAGAPARKRPARRAAAAARQPDARPARSAAAAARQPVAVAPRLAPVAPPAAPPAPPARKPSKRKAGGGRTSPTSVAADVAGAPAPKRPARRAAAAARGPDARPARRAAADARPPVAVAPRLALVAPPAAPPAPDVDDSAPAAPPDDDSDAHAPPDRLFAMGRELMGMLEAGVTGAAVVGLLDSMREAAAAAGAF